MENKTKNSITKKHGKSKSRKNKKLIIGLDEFTTELKRFFEHQDEYEDITINMFTARCPQCGIIIDDEDREFCPNCGADVSEEEIGWINPAFCHALCLKIERRWHENGNKHKT